MVMAVTKNGSCHVVERGHEGAVKAGADLRKKPHKLAVSAPQSALIVNIGSTAGIEFGWNFREPR
jgi:hypothetical protein